jgi:hypothetical protein
VATLRQHLRLASPLPEPLWAALLGFVAGLSMGDPWRPLYALLALVTGG